MNIIILNMPKDTKPETLYGLFKPFGKIESCNLVMDEKSGLSKGFGFVEMQDEAEAKKAIGALHSTKLGKNTIRVKEADEKK